MRQSILSTGFSAVLMCILQFSVRQTESGMSTAQLRECCFSSSEPAATNPFRHLLFHKKIVEI